MRNKRRNRVARNLEERVLIERQSEEKLGGLARGLVRRHLRCWLARTKARSIMTVWTRASRLGFDLENLQLGCLAAQLGISLHQRLSRRGLWLAPSA